MAPSAERAAQLRMRYDSARLPKLQRAHSAVAFSQDQTNPGQMVLMDSPCRLGGLPRLQVLVCGKLGTYWSLIGRSHNLEWVCDGLTLKVQM